MGKKVSVSVVLDSCIFSWGCHLVLFLPPPTSGEFHSPWPTLTQARLSYWGIPSSQSTGRHLHALNWYFGFSFSFWANAHLDFFHPSGTHLLSFRQLVTTVRDIYKVA